MVIAVISDETKMELMTQFCIAYCGILSKHELCSTGSTGKYISEATGLDIECILSQDQDALQQITSRVAYDEIDVLLIFHSPDESQADKDNKYSLLRMCDVHNVPTATNIATAEALICALGRGDLDWRELVNPHSYYNQKKKANK